MAGDSPDWAYTPPSEAGTLNGTSLFLTGAINIATGTPTTGLSHTVPAGKTFYAQGMSYGHQATAAAFSAEAALVKNGVGLLQLASAMGESILFGTPVPFVAGSLVGITLIYQGAAGPDIMYCDLWGWEQ